MHPRSPWGNTNQVVSNRAVSKGPLHPSKTKIIVFFVFDMTPFVRQCYIYIYIYARVDLFTCIYA